MVFCAPDAGAGKRVEHLIDTVKGKYDHSIPYVIINKTRKEANVVDKMVLIGDVKGKNVVIVGDILHSRVALSNIFALQMQGAEVKVCGPKTLMPKHIESLGVKVETNLRKALEWCDVANMLRIQLERQDAGIPYFPSLREYTELFGLTQDRLNSLGKEIVIMHPGPINRGVEISSEVADSSNSIILDQVENGVAVRMAVLYLLAGRAIEN